MIVTSGVKYLRHTPTDVIHHSEWQESHKCHSYYDLPNLSVCILLSQFYFGLGIFFFVTFRTFNVVTNCAFCVCELR